MYDSGVRSPLKRLLSNLLITLISLGLTALAGLAVLELFLRNGGFSQTSVLWQTAEDVQNDRVIDRFSSVLSDLHPYGFTDRIDTPAHEPNDVYTVAVIGDSFVWGDGLLPGVSWPHDVRRRLVDAGVPARILAWGINGWSTQDQLHFLQAMARDNSLAGVDEIWFGFVTNDPDVGRIEQKTSPAFHFPIPALVDVFPNADGFMSGLLQTLYETWIDPESGYAAWEAALWTNQNLEAYANVLAELKSFSDSQGIAVKFVLTPHRPDAAFFEPKYKALKALLNDAGIPVVDVLPAVLKELRDKGTPPLYRELWANPGDAHPGQPLINVYAQEMTALLTKQLSTMTAGAAQENLPRCAFGDVVTEVTQPIMFAFGDKSYLRLKGQVTSAIGLSEQSIRSAFVTWPGGRSPVFQRDLFAGDSSRVYDAIKFERREPASTFWADVPDGVDLDRFTLQLTLASNCVLDAPVIVKQPATFLHVAE